VLKDHMQSIMNTSAWLWL